MINCIRITFISYIIFHSDFFKEFRSNPIDCDNPIHSSSRSEEHTSELQSLRHLVCRLLLEKIKLYRSPAWEIHPPVGAAPRNLDHADYSDQCHDAENDK